MIETALTRYVADGGWERVCGREIWKMIFEGCLAKARRTPDMALWNPDSFLLYGPRGAGKDFLAEAFAAEAVKKGFYAYAGGARELQEELSLPRHATGIISREHAADLSEETPFGERPLLELLRRVQMGANIFLYLRWIDRVSRKRIKVHKLVHFLRTMRMADAIVVATARDLERIPPELLSMLQICHLANPEKEERALFLKQRLGAETLAEGTLLEELVALTEGYAYGQLSELARNLVFFSTVGGPVSAVDCGKILELTFVQPVGSDRPGYPFPRDALFNAYGWPALGIGQPAAGGVIPPNAGENAMPQDGRALSQAGGAQPSSGGVASIRDNPLSGLEMNEEELAKTDKELKDIREDIGKGTEDYSEAELREMGYRPMEEFPEDTQRLEELDEAARMALFALSEEGEELFDED